MKNLFYIFLLTFIPMISFSAVADDNPYTQVANAIATAISKGDAAGVAKYFDSSVDVTILGEDGTYSKSQAEQMLKSFFSKHRVDNFKIVHNVDSPNGSSSSFVGQLTSGGKNYRLYVLMADSGSSKIVQEISIRER